MFEKIKEAKDAFRKRSGLRKIADAPKPCLNPEHNPPSHIVLKPGTYEYICPGCRRRTVFTIPLIFC